MFLDTETTGLAGGAGTAAFLIGVGWVEGERFHVRQYFMRDYHEEAALLHGLADELARFESLVTFNGKMFDVPLLDARFRLNRARFPLGDAPHLDLLHPARRLWKARLESCRLQSLEAALMGLRRHGDIPGEEIPQIYFDFVRRRDARKLARVFDHNRQDIVSLAALAVLACQWVEEGCAEDARDVYSLARVLERARLYERSEAEYRRALDLDAGPLRGKALLRLAWRAKRAGRPRARARAVGRGGRGRRGGGVARAGDAPRAPPPRLRRGARGRRAGPVAARPDAAARGEGVAPRRGVRAEARAAARGKKGASRSPSAGTRRGPGSAPAS